MSHPRPRRSVLYVPADKPRAIAKARTLGADAVIFDLEDAIAPEGKAAAREALRQTLTNEPFDCEVAIRINGMGTEWATEDILAAIAARADAILVPKVTGPEELRIVGDSLADTDAIGRTSVWTMVETPKAILRVAEIAALAETGVPLRALVLGTNDIVLETRVQPGEDRAALVPWFTQIVIAARAYGLDVIDGVFNVFRDEARFEAEARQARLLGMDGKSLIHPVQVEPANRIFAPQPDDIARARSILAAFADPANAGKGVIALDGTMVERLHVNEAERLLALSAGIERLSR
jgi:citrate lyase subunit beta/citryl-CoA lyase